MDSRTVLVRARRTGFRNACKLSGPTWKRLADRMPCSTSLIAQVEAGHKPASQALMVVVA
jgi:hypothetical protein